MTAYRDRLNAGYYAPKTKNTQPTITDALDANREALEKLTGADKPVEKKPTGAKLKP